MTLPKEWLQEADRIASQTTDGISIALNMATAYKQEVEKKLKENIESVEKQVASMTDGFEIAKMTTEAMGAAYKITLEQLQTLKPTSND